MRRKIAAIILSAATVVSMIPVSNFAYAQDSAAQEASTEDTGSDDMQETSGSTDTDSKDKESLTISAAPLTMTYGDKSASLEERVTLPEGYDGTITYSIVSGGDVISLTDDKVTSLKSGSASILVAASETDTFHGAEATLNVTVQKKDLGVIPFSDVALGTLDLTYDGTNKRTVTGSISSALESGDSVSVNVTIETDSANAGSYNAKVAAATIVENDKYTGTIDLSTAGAVPVTIKKLALTVSISDAEVSYGSSDWRKLKRGSYDSVISKIKNNASVTDALSAALSSKAQTALESAMEVTITDDSLSAAKYKVGTYTDAIVVSFGASDNFTFTSAGTPVLKITEEATEDDKALWERLEVSDTQNAYTKDGTLYLAADGSATYKVKDGDLYDSVAIRISDSYSDTVTGNASAGNITGSFYLYQSDDSSTRTDASKWKIGAQDNTIPNGAIISDSDAPIISFDGKNGSITEDTTVSDVAFTNHTNGTPSVSFVAKDALSGVDTVSYVIASVTKDDADKTLKSLYDSGKKLTYDDALDLSSITADGYYIVIAKAADNVGNESYAASEGIVRNSENPGVTVSGLKNGASYANDVNYEIGVENAGDILCTLQEISVAVTAEGEKVQGSAAAHTDSFTLDADSIRALTGLSENPDISELSDAVKTIDLTGVISKEINADNIKVVIAVTDLAGNKSSVSYEIRIDMDAPELTVSYDNNEPKNEKYFNTARGATLTVKERAYNEEKLTLTLGINGKNASYSLSDIKDGKAESVSYIGKEENEESKSTTYSFFFGQDADIEYTIDASLSDLAGNQSKDLLFADGTKAGEDFVVDMIPVEAAVVYSTAAGTLTTDERSYTNEMVNASLTISDKHYDAAGATLAITQTNAAGEEVSAYDAGGILSLIQDASLTGTVDKTISLPAFSKDANYTVTMTLADLAGNVTTLPAAFFTVDKTAPTGVLYVQTDTTSGTYTEKSSSAAFRHITGGSAAATASEDDETSGVASVKYYLYVPDVSASGTYSVPDAETLPNASWTEFPGSLNLSSEQQCVIYLRIEDKAGNVTYLNASDGVIVDHTSPNAPTITLSGGDKIYNSDIPFTISVTDPVSGGTYAGLQSVTYEILKDGVVTQSNSYNYSDKTARVQSLSAAETVSAALNNSNHVTIRVSATDYAGNTSTAEKTVRIDTTAPRVEVTYDKTTGNGYYNSTRTATIQVYERNFDPSLFNLSLSKELGAAVSQSNWILASNMGESDDAVSTMTITFASDDTYALTASLTDLAGNAGSLGRTDKFTVDKTAPVVQVSFDKTKASGYYNQIRTATITVTERNFDSAAFSLSLLAALDGQGIRKPSLSSWTTSGNTHTATLVFSSDGDYSFTCSDTDPAGNSSNSASSGSFTIDMTMPVITITGVEDAHAYNGSITPIISYTDRNQSSSDIKITLKGNRHEEVELTGTEEVITNGKKVTLADIEKSREEDDIYTLTATYTDAAGNTTTKEIVFSVNRFGSNFTFDGSTQKLLNQYYLQSGKDLVIYETNVNTITDLTITVGCEGETKTLKKGTDYTVEENTEEGWKVYTYTIKGSVFDKEGVYDIVITSVDEAGNKQDNQLKEQPISIKIDKTAPSAYILNAENGGRYNAKTKDVQIKLTDESAVGSAVIYIDGVAVKTLTAEEIEECGGVYTLSVEEADKFQEITVEVTDAAGNTYTTDPVSILVTTNALTRFFYNKPLFIGSIVTLAAVVILVIFWLRRKKKEKKNV